MNRDGRSKRERGIERAEWKKERGIESERERERERE